MSVCRPLSGIVAGVVLACACLPAMAHIAKLQQPYPYLVVEQDLAAVLREFGRNLQMRVALTRNVRGTVRAMRDVDSAEGFLRRLARAHDLVWYLDRDTLLVSTREENGTEVVPVPSLDAQARRDLASEWSRRGAGIAIDADDRAAALVVTGPDSLRARIAALAGGQPPAAPSPELAVRRADGAQITVYRGNAGTRQVVVPR